MQRNFRRLDLAAPAPEDVCIGDRNAARLEMSINGRFVLKQQLFVRSVRNSHDVYILEFRAGFAPIAMRQNMMSPDFAARLDFAPRRHRPMKKRVEARDTHSARGWLDVLQE